MSKKIYIVKAHQSHYEWSADSNLAAFEDENKANQLIDDIKSYRKALKKRNDKTEVFRKNYIEANPLPVAPIKNKISSGMSQKEHMRVNIAPYDKAKKIYDKEVFDWSSKFNAAEFDFKNSLNLDIERIQTNLDDLDRYIEMTDKICNWCRIEYSIQEMELT